MIDTITKDEMKAIDCCVRTVEVIGAVFTLTNHDSVRVARGAIERVNNMPGYLHLERQNVAVPVERLEDLDLALRHLPLLVEPSRETVASYVRTCKLAAYVGGRHVSVHAPGASGQLQGDPLLMITGNFGDWL